MKNLFAEFRRRNVFRVAVLYLVSAWLIAQVADVIIGLGELPPSIGRVVLIILALGFPVTVVLSWFLEWTPEGIRLETEAGVQQPAAQQTGRRLDYIIIALLSVALAYFVSTHDWSGPYEVAGASIAVLPFENRSAEPDDLYFTDGIHEDILTQLAKISALVVISRTSVMQYRDSGKTIPEIAKELGVANILEGGVQRAGQRVRINLQLIEAATDNHLWADTYDRELSVENVFAIQSEIATTIADVLHAKLLPLERERIEAVPTHNLAAYDGYLLGRRLIASRDEQDLLGARQYFEQAVALDPGFALAWSSLADSLLLLSSWGRGNEQEFIAAADIAAHRALELNPDLGEAYTSVGLVRQFRQEPAENFASYLERGVELSPNSADARKWYAGYLSEAGRDAESLEQLLMAVRLDPMSPIVRVNLAGALKRVGRRDEAAVQIRRALEIDPKFQPAIMEVYGTAPPVEALAVVSRAIKAHSTNPWLLVDMVFKYLEVRDDDRAAEWVELLDRVEPDSIQRQIGNLNLSLYRRDQAGALEWAARLLPIERGVITVPSRTLLLHDIERGDLSAAVARYEQKYPNLLDDDPQVSFNYPAAIDVAMLMSATDDPARANRLLERSLAFMATLTGEEDLLEYGIFQARIYGLQGRREECLLALSKAIDAGWRFQWWWFMEQDPALEPVRDDPRFIRMHEELEAEAKANLEAVRAAEARGEIAIPSAL